ncbi:MAG: cytochrome c-type biogenesis protein CcmH [Acuticoccus sp.]
MRALLAALVLMFAANAAALAVTPAEQLDDPALEARAREISRELRCLVCQNQSIDESDAALAKDLRVLVRERLSAGDSDGEVFAYLTARYGDFVRLRPPFSLATLLLWITPALAAVFAVGAAIVYLRSRQGGTDEPARLSEEEERALGELLARRAPRENGTGGGTTG